MIRQTATNRQRLGLQNIVDVASQSLSFGGNDIILLTPNDACKQNYFRLEFSVKFPATFSGGAAKQFICKWDEPIQVFFETNGTLHLAVKYANFWHEVSTTKASWAANTWFRISCNVSADRFLRIYVDNVNDGAVDSGESGGAKVTAPGATWFWGASDANGAEGLIATLGEVVFDQTPSKSGGAPNAKITDAIYPILWHLDEGAGTSVTNSGTGGTLTGSLGAGEQSPSWTTGQFAANTYNTGFVQRRNTKFVENGKEFKFIGANNYPLIQDNLTDAQLNSFFECCNTDGIRVIRSWCFNKNVPATNTVGNFRYLDSGALLWVESTFISLDRVLAKARQHGVKMILPLVDQWQSNKGDYCVWNNTINATAYDTVTGDEFHVDTNIKRMFKDYIDKLTARVNTINGITYSADDTIFAWELGNELRFVGGVDSNSNTLASYRLTTMTAWQKEIADYIKSKDSNHLVGSGGISQFYDYVTDDPAHNGTYYGLDFNSQHTLASIDYFDFHLYPYEDSPTFTLRSYGQSGGHTGSTRSGFLFQLKEYLTSAKVANKPCVVGEYGIDKRNTVVAPFPAYPRGAHFRELLETVNGMSGLSIWHYTNLFDDNNYNLKPDGVHTGANANTNSNDDDSSLRTKLRNSSSKDQGKRIPI